MDCPVAFTKCLSCMCTLIIIFKSCIGMIDINSFGYVMGDWSNTLLLFLNLHNLIDVSMETEKVRVFVTNSQKMAKVLLLPATVSGGELYYEAATAHKLEQNQIHLHLDGKLLSTKRQVALYDSAIIHLVNIEQVNTHSLSFRVVQLGQAKGPIKFTTNPQTTVRQFMDGPLFDSIGLKSDQQLLVYMGRRLTLQKSFLQQDVENDSQLISVSLEYVRRQHEQREADEAAKSETDVHELQTPEQPRDIYPSPDFVIAVPEEVNARDEMNLIFDSKMHLASSIHNYQLEPNEIIQEEVPNSEEVKDESGANDLLGFGEEQQNTVVPELLVRESNNSAEVKEEEGDIDELLGYRQEEQISAVREALGESTENQVYRIMDEEDGKEGDSLNEQVVTSLQTNGRMSIQFGQDDDDLI